MALWTTFVALSNSVGVFYLPRQFEALLPALLGSIHIVPFIEDTGQAKIRFAGNRLRRITY